MILTTLLLSLLTPQQNDWPYFGGTAEGDVGVAIDPNSIRRDGPRRTFIGKMTSVGDTGRHLMVTMRADCAARTLYITHVQRFVDDKMLGEEDEKGEGYKVVDDPSVDPTLDYVCAK